MNFQPKKPLQTLSDFITQLQAETSTFTSLDALEIVVYNNFLKQPLTKEMFVGEERIFIDYDVTIKALSLGIFAANFYCETVQDLAELSKKECFEVYIKA